MEKQQRRGKRIAEMKDRFWKKRAFLFLLSQCVTLFGSMIVQMAVIWYVTLNTKSGFWVAAFSIASSMPQFLVSFLGGVWADRYSRKRLIIGADMGIAFSTLAVFFMLPVIKNNAVFLSVLLILSAVRSVGAGIQVPAVQAAIPELVPEEKLMSFNGFYAASQSAVQFAAPGAAGIFLTAATLRESFLIDVATAAIGTGILLQVSLPRQEKNRVYGSVLADIKKGAAYTFLNKTVRGILAVYGLFVFLCVPAGFLAGLYVARTFGASYGYLAAVELAGFAGMTAGGILTGMTAGKNLGRSREKLLAAGLGIFGGSAAAMGILESFPPYLFAMFLYGTALTEVQSVITTILQERTDQNFQGRVFGVMSSVYSGFMPAGMAVFGPMADYISLSWIMVGSGMILFCMGTAIFVQSRKYKKSCK